MAAALEGVLVLAIEQAVAAPYCSCRLADAGARVIKVERPQGDFARFYDDAVGGLSSYFVWLNRGKESLVADIKDKGDAALLHAILESADVFIQNLAPGAAARAGFGFDELHARYPRLIIADISGYGDTSAYAHMKAYDLLVQAESGLASVTGHAAGPGRVGVSVCDIACGVSMYAAILEALLERSRTGRGQGLKASLFDSIADWMNVPLLQYEGGGRAPARVGLAHPTICPYGVFSTAQGVQVLIAVQNEREWGDFCAHFLRDVHLPGHAGFESNVARVANRTAVDGRIAAVFATLTEREATTRLVAGGTAYGLVSEIKDFARHPALRRVTIETPRGPANLAAPAVISSEGARALGRVPALGEHSELIRAEFAA
jgi:crotonobetainyl-CoA:carnitine CoA-transferase CaiB-like acyl-CoA transferase